MGRTPIEGRRISTQVRGGLSPRPTGYPRFISRQRQRPCCRIAGFEAVDEEAHTPFEPEQENPLANTITRAVTVHLTTWQDDHLRRISTHFEVGEP